MFEIKFYEADYENRGELLEDFPDAEEIRVSGYFPRTGLTRFRFIVKKSVYKPGLIQDRTLNKSKVFNSGSQGERLEGHGLRAYTEHRHQLK